MAAEVAHNINTAMDWLSLVALGAVAGAVGQSARAIVGLKKANDSAPAGTTLGDNFDASRLLFSLLIGAVAGVLAGVGTVHDLDHISTELFLGLVAAGYGGADFIEGFMLKNMPNAGGDKKQPNKGQPAAAGDKDKPSPTDKPATADDAVG
jgi:hypothetical protein